MPLKTTDNEEKMTRVEMRRRDLWRGYRERENQSENQGEGQRGERREECRSLRILIRHLEGMVRNAFIKYLAPG